MKNIISLLILTIISLSFYSCSLTDEEKIDRALANWNQSVDPGFTVTVLKDDSLIYSKGFGLANIAIDRKNNTNTIFNIGSISKSVTAACIMKLVEEGKLSLDDSLSSIFPTIYDELGRATVRQLMNHTSGLRDNESFGQLIESKGVDPNTGFFIGDDQDNWDIIKMQNSINFPHGSAYLYNNMGYWLLGQIVEKISGRTLEAFSKEEFFTPLKMNHTSFGQPNNEKLAIGYHIFDPNEKSKPIKLDAKSYGDGGLYSSTEDMVKWFNEIISEKEFGSEFWMNLKTKGVLNNQTEINYGGGLEIKKKNGRLVYSHGGLVPGYFSMLKSFPEEKVVIAVCANQTQINASEISRIVEDIILPQKEAEIIQLSEAEAKKYLGIYQQTSGSEIGLVRHIIKKGDEFYYHRPGSMDTQIYPIGSDEFIMPFGSQQADIKITTDPMSSQRKLVFKGNDGEADRVYMEMMDKPTVKNTPIDPKDYVGIYESDETQLTWTIFQKDEELFIDVNTFQSPLHLVKDHRFSFENRFSIVFNSDIQKNSSSFTLDFGKAKNIEFVKLK